MILYLLSINREISNFSGRRKLLAGFKSINAIRYKVNSSFLIRKIVTNNDINSQIIFIIFMLNYEINLKKKIS